jgi:hypothetical protein
MASIETNAPTAQVTPMRIVRADDGRAATPERPTRSKARDCRMKFMCAL